MNGCSDMKKAYLNQNPDALEYLKKIEVFFLEMNVAVSFRD